MLNFLFEPWPWYIGGPLIGLVVPLLLLAGNKAFGISSNFRHICAACLPSGSPFFQYNWRNTGGWNLRFAGGIVLGGFLAGYIFRNPEPVDLAPDTIDALRSLGIQSFDGLVPSDLFNWVNFLSPEGFVAMGIGGFLVGFGTRYADGCTSGHSITGIANLQAASLTATIGFFIGGLITTWLLLPLIL